MASKPQTFLKSAHCFKKLEKFRRSKSRTKEIKPVCDSSSKQVPDTKRTSKAKSKGKKPTNLSRNNFINSSLSRNTANSIGKYTSLKSGKKVPINIRQEERSTKRAKNSSRKRSKISVNLKKTKTKNGIYYRNSVAFNNPRSICLLNNPCGERSVNFLKNPSLKLKTKSNSRNNKASVDGTSSVSF